MRAFGVGGLTNYPSRPDRAATTRAGGLCGIQTSSMPPMRLPITTALLLSLSAGMGFGQGTVRFEWMGNQNQVLGGFDVTLDELFGYTNWGSPVLLNSITFTDFYGVVMSPSQDFWDIWGTYDYQGWSFAINLWDFNRGLV